MGNSHPGPTHEEIMDYNKRVYVYWNIRRKLWSVRQAGKVVDHLTGLSLNSCKFLVGKKGQERVRREKTKNVHAGVSGYLDEHRRWHVDEVYNVGLVVTYNPYKHDTFVLSANNKKSVYFADYVLMDTINERPSVTAVGIPLRFDEP